MNIQTINFNKNIQALNESFTKQAIQNEKAASGVDFASFLNKAISEINDAQRVSAAYDEGLISGKVDNLHEPLIAAKKSEILFSFGLEVRAQILDAYREIMRIQL